MKLITSEKIEAYLRSLVSNNQRINLDAIEKALAKLRWTAQIDDTDSLVTQYCATFLEKLERVACEEFPIQNRKKTVHFMLRKVHYPALKAEMSRLLKFDN